MAARRERQVEIVVSSPVDVVATATIQVRVKMATADLRGPNVRKAFKVIIEEVIVLIKDALKESSFNFKC